MQKMANTEQLQENCYKINVTHFHAREVILFSKSSLYQIKLVPSDTKRNVFELHGKITITM